MDTELKNLLDNARVQEALHLYCRGVDRCDVELIKSCYHPESFDDHGYWKGNGHDFAEFIARRLSTENASTTHALSNVIIDVQGDDVRSESYVHATLVRPERDVVDLIGARYVDHLVRGGEHGWLIMDRVVVMDWRYQGSAGEFGAPVDMSNFAYGSRFPDDPSYELLRHG